jgi:hypothetical protein
MHYSKWKVLINLNVQDEWYNGKNKQKINVKLKNQLLSINLKNYPIFEFLYLWCIFIWIKCNYDVYLFFFIYDMEYLQLHMGLK